MKHIPQTPIGISRLPACAEPSDAGTGQVSSPLPPVLQAAQIRRHAKARLDLPGADHRLQLISAQLMVILLSLAIPMLLDCLAVVIYVLPYFASVDDFAWLVILRGILWGANGLLVVLPLLCGLYRMAVRMTKDENARDVSAMGVWACLYPFTSLRAYGRTLYVGIRGLLRFCLMLMPSAILIGAAAWGLPLLGNSVSPVLCVVLWVLAIAAACLALGGMAVWNARDAGLAYFVFAYPERCLADVSDAFKRLPRKASTPLLMRLCLSGWFLLSAAEVLLPLILHTMPYILLCEAVYGQSLETENTDFFKIQEENQP